ncbi:hypothetical protein [Patiriisocius marinus]|nr:hypothetical protein [Patiriisocius marinus]
MLLLFFTCCFTAYSQTVNDIPIEEIDVEYLRIVGTSRMMSKKVTIEIDFGQDTKFFGSGKETQVKDIEGKLVKFNSMIDALNFMSSNGYDFVQAYAFSVNNQNVYHYLMKKK